MNIRLRHPVTRSLRHAAPGFTLVEAIVVIIIIGVLAAVIAPRLIGRVGQAKGAAAAANANAIASALKLYMADYGSLPPSGDLGALLAKAGHGPYLDNSDQLKDPWGKPFVLVIPGRKNVDFDIVSYGQDGQPGGDGDNQDIVKP